MTVLAFTPRPSVLMGGDVVIDARGETHFTVPDALTFGCLTLCGRSYDLHGADVAAPEATITCDPCQNALDAARAVAAEIPAERAEALAREFRLRAGALLAAVAHVDGATL